MTLQQIVLLNCVHLKLRIHSTLLKSLKYLWLWYARLRCLQVAYSLQRRLWVIEECIDFLQYLLIVLCDLLEMHKILNQSPQPSPSVLKSFRFAAIYVLNELENTVAELLLLVRFFDILKQLSQWLASNNLQHFINRDHIVIVLLQNFVLLIWRAAINVERGGWAFIDHLPFLRVNNVSRFVPQFEHFCGLLVLITENRSRHSLSQILIIELRTEFIVTLLKLNEANVLFL